MTSPFHDGRMINVGGWMADTTQEMGIPCTVGEIKKRQEEMAQEQFALMTVPELFFWSVGVEYVGYDIKFSEVD